MTLDSRWPPRHAVILAAGLGQRLLPLTARVPKCMVPVNGTPMIDRAVGALALHGCEEVTVVAGHLGHVLRSHLDAQQHPVKIRFVDNPRYADSNSMLSLTFGLEHVHEGTWIIEGDIVFDPRLLAMRGAAPISWFVDSSSVTMPGIHVSSAPDGMASAVTVLREPADASASQHKSVGVLCLRAEGIAPLRLWLADAVRAGRESDYYDLVLRDHLDARLVGTVDVAGIPWFEVDTPEELAIAERIFA